MPTYFADPSDVLFDQILIAADQGLVAEEDGFEDDIPEVVTNPSGSSCVQDAINIYDFTVANCNAVHNVAVHGCNNVFNAAMGICNNTFNTTAASALAAFEVCMLQATAAGVAALILCVAFTGGWGLFACGATALLVVARLEIGCGRTLSAAIAAAATARTGCITLARATRVACLATATATRNACLANAEQVLLVQLSSCD